MSSVFEVEISDKFSEAKDCENYVYSKIDGECTVRKTRLYEIEGEGTPEQLEEIVRDVLADPVSQTWSIKNSEQNGSSESTDNNEYCLDVSLKPGVLDLEEEYVGDFLRDDSYQFDVRDLRVKDRYYLTASRNEQVDSVVDDLVNPVIHEWSVRTCE